MKHKLKDAMENYLTEEYRLKGDPFKNLNQLMDETTTSGLAISVINQGQVTTHTYGHTNQDKDQPVNDQTLFQAASISKSVNALAVMRLVDQGQLDLDQPVNNYLTSWQVKDNAFTQEGPVTLRNLLSHTAGTSVSGFPGYDHSKAIPSLLDVLEGNHASNTDPIEVVRTINKSFSYSGGGTTIIQQVLLDLTGQSYQELMKQLVLDPLGMDHSFFSDKRLAPDQEAHVAAGHDWDGQIIPGNYHVYPPMAAAGLWTTAGDLAKLSLGFIKAIQGHEDGLISQALAKEMIQPLLGSSYSLGLEVFPRKQDTLLGHTGSNDGYTCGFYFHPTDNYGFALMTNSDRGYQMLLPLLRSVARACDWNSIIYPEFDPVELDKDQATTYIGRYQTGFDKTMTILHKDQDLLARVYGEDDRLLTYVGGDTFVDHKREILFAYDPAQSTYTLNEKPCQPLLEGQRLAMDHIENADLEAAASTYKTLLSKEEISTSDLEMRLINLAYEFSESGKNLEALDLMIVATQVMPESSNSWDSLGEFHYELKNYDQCVLAMEKSFELDPQNDNAQDYIQNAKEAMNQ